MDGAEGLLSHLIILLLHLLFDMKKQRNVPYWITSYHMQFILHHDENLMYIIFLLSYQI